MCHKNLKSTVIILKWLQNKSLMYLVSYLIDGDIETVLTKFRVFPGMLLIFMCIISSHELFKKNFIISNI